MGFWHTGYMEFHEPEDFDFTVDPSPPSYPCEHCGKTYLSKEALWKHRFEAHPLRRPVMFLRGRELGTHPVRITRRLAQEDVRVEGCDCATINGRDISVSSLPSFIADVSFDVCKVVLSKSDVRVNFELDIRIASESDLEGIEKQFRKMAIGGRLDTRAIEEFILTVDVFKSAIGYCDGLCAYLYGILAKEKASDSSLKYEAYISRFNKAAENLSVYERPLARTITSMVDFHFNHFREAANKSGASRIGRVANRYAFWIESPNHKSAMQNAGNEFFSPLETLVTDWETEQILRWGNRPLKDLKEETDEIESFLIRDLAEFDKVKLHILLGELYVLSGDLERALSHARAVRNLPSLERWAEALISKISEDIEDNA
ncbi:hypothetical protein [Desulfatiglans anilini]|uniref:hypothetical protein n=1 Tax=Desulfatiglans anilini TaxID=90728 RepID=UPI0003FB47AF|nr:hypothetical protein [Desulfatiglans anilini]